MNEILMQQLTNFCAVTTQTNDRGFSIFSSIFLLLTLFALLCAGYFIYTYVISKKTKLKKRRLLSFAVSIVIAIVFLILYIVLSGQIGTTFAFINTKIVNVKNFKYLGVGIIVSIGLAIGAMIIGFILGTLGAAFKMSKSEPLNYIAMLYVEVIRGTPMLLQIYFLFIGVPVAYTYITGGGHLDVNPLVVGLFAMGINSGAYSTELIRSGIQAIDKGQWEASKSIGLNYPLTMRHVILPQVFKRIVPPLCSEVIVLIKDSSLVSYIGGLELFQRSQVLATKYYDSIPPLVMATVIYLIVTVIVSNLAKKLERRLAVND